MLSALVGEPPVAHLDEDVLRSDGLGGSLTLAVLRDMGGKRDGY